MNNIENKVVVITGASSGLGEATARLLAKKGAKVALGARRTEKLEAIVHDIRAEGGQAEFIGMDITKPQEVQALIEKALSAFGQIDVLVNNAGLMSIAPLSELKVDEWD
ncbi:MAG: SDR family oxidoreductase, partial [Acinetobacter junii]